MDLEQIIVLAIARVLYVEDCHEKTGHHLVLHKDEGVPSAYVNQAWKLAGMVQARNTDQCRGDLPSLLRLAAYADRRNGYAIDLTFVPVDTQDVSLVDLVYDHKLATYATEFGYYLAMEALGYDVLWKHAHRNIGLDVPPL